jgi:hypothetical protein
MRKGDDVKVKLRLKMPFKRMAIMRRMRSWSLIAILAVLAVIVFFFGITASVECGSF